MFGIAALIVLAATQPALAALLKPAFDGSFVERDLNTVGKMSMLLVLVFVVRGASSYLSTMAMTIVSSRVIQDLRNAMFEKVMALPNTTLNLLTTGTLVSKVTYDATLLGDACTRVVQRGIAAASSVFDLIDERPEVETGNLVVARAAGHIEFVGVRFRYGDDEAPAIDNLNLSVGAGERVALVGPSGSGKSTTANLIPRFFQPDSGRILLDGADINTLTLASLHEQIALVSQEVMLFEGTVRENIAYGPLQEKGEQALWRAIDAAHARAFIEELPMGLDTEVGQHGVRLSGGQRQRLAIARAFLKDAPILILDEATSSLDNRSEGMIKRALSDLSRGRTTIIIAHRLSTIESADRIIVLDAGRIVDQGRHDELLVHSALYSSLYQIQFHRTDGNAITDRKVTAK